MRRPHNGFRVSSGLWRAACSAVWRAGQAALAEGEKLGEVVQIEGSAEGDGGFMTPAGR